MSTKTYHYGIEKKLHGILYTPEGYDPSNRYPAVIVFPAFEGISEFAILYAERLVQEGYITLVADVYGEGRQAFTLDGCFELISPFLKDRSLVRERSLAAFESLKSYPGVDSTKIGAIGFCFGGMCVLEIARSGAPLKAGVTFHGVLQKSDLPTHSIQAALLILHGYADPQVPPSQLQVFGDEMQAANTHDWTITFYGKAQHSFTDPKTGTYDPIQELKMGRLYDEHAANRSEQTALNFLSDVLKC